MKKISIKDIFKGVVAVIAAATLFSCGEKTQSEKVIKDFIENYSIHKDYSNINFSKIDSTFYLKQKDIAKMLENKAIKQIYNSNYKFPAYKDGDKLVFIKVDYVVNNGKKHTQTFYLDKDIKMVVAVKEN